MTFIRTVVWFVLLLGLVVFSLSNWTEVEVTLWDGFVMETKLPALIIISFLIGFVPMWLLYRADRWRLTRRIASLETALQTSQAVHAAPPTAPVSPVRPDGDIDGDGRPEAPPELPLPGESAPR